MRPLISRLIMVMFLLVSWLWPATCAAGSYLLTGFVPELATPTFDITAGYFTHKLKSYDISRFSYGARLSYVPYPGLETVFDASLLSYRVETDLVETGLGGGLTLKHQFTELFEEVDVAAALGASFGVTENITESDASLLLLVSRDVPDGWAPFGGGGVAYKVQKLDTTKDFMEKKEKGLEPVVYLGVKYMFQNHLSFTADAVVRDGIGLEIATGYRF